MALNSPLSFATRRAKRKISTMALVLMLLLSACSTANDQAVAPKPERPIDWSSVDIGGSNLGTASIAGSQVRLSGVGDISDLADSFHFTFAEGAGNAGIVAQLEDYGTTAEGYPKASVTIRGSLDPTAANLTIYATNKEFTGLVLQGRSRAGGDTKLIATRGGVSAPLWLRLVRDGNRVAADVSADGTRWEPVGAIEDIQLGETIYLGLAAASGSSQRPLQATFRNIDIVGATQGGGPEGPQSPTPSPPPSEQPAPPTQPAPNPGPKVETTYQVDRSTDFLNPDRGFHSEVNLLTGAGFSSARSGGNSLVRAYVRLDDYRNQSLPSSFLRELGGSLSQAREAGVKIILRFSYNFGNAPDAPLARVLEHINQLKPVLAEYEDIISVLQAGFIGGWGEWHGSTNGLTSAANKRTIGLALLEALPDSRMVQVRAPFHRRDIVGSPSSDVKFFGASDQARLGFKNDCFLSDASDTGTYAGDQVRDRSETADFTRYTATGGETCTIGFPSTRQDCSVALTELATFHWDYLNAGYYSGVLNRWRDQGCYNEISRRLGYRLALESGSVTDQVKPGGTLTLDLRMRNDGFGKVYNPRPIDIVLRSVDTGETRTLRAVGDARELLPLAGQVRDLRLSVVLPTNLLTGAYEALLSLPDPAPTLQGDSRYNIRLANVGMWQATTGANELGLTTNLVN